VLAIGASAFGRRGSRPGRRFASTDAALGRPADVEDGLRTSFVVASLGRRASEFPGRAPDIASGDGREIRFGV
jgi:hypothetical protein